MSKTIGELYGPAMEITDQEEADRYFAGLVDDHVTRWSKGRAEAEQTIRINLGYYAGYYDQETRARVERLFRCAHPFFGSIADNGPPTPDQALNAGKKLAGK